MTSQHVTGPTKDVSARYDNHFVTNCHRFL